MTGLMRQKFRTAKRTMTVLAFSLIVPFGEGAAHALPRPVPATYPSSAPASMKAGEPRQEEDQISIVASLRAGTGSMINGMLRAKRYKNLIALNNKLSKGAPAKRPPGEVKNILAEESKIFTEAKSFEPEDRLNIVIASVFLNAGNLRALKPSEGSLVDVYLGNIESLGFRRISGAVRQWLKNKKGDMMALYKGMKACLEMQM